jgi:glucose/arabinose dehydrogenase
MKKTQILIPLLLFIVIIAAGCLPTAEDAATVIPVERTPTFTPTVQPTPPPPPQPTQTPAVLPTATQAPIPRAPSLPDPAGYTFTPYLKNVDQPLYLTHAGDGSGRVFIVLKNGRVLAAQDGELLPQLFLDIRGRVDGSSSERGLLGLAFHPDYAQNGYFYVNYTDPNGDTVVSRFETSPDPNLADADSEQVLLRIGQPYANHNGGMLAFGPDGYLYIGTGDGGSGGDPQGNAQNPDSLLGKILRLDVDSGEPYAIPDGNAPVGGAEIWAVGLRNPWRFSFDRATGDLFIGDVGQNQWEEIHFMPAGILGGVNLGWDYYEGTHVYEGEPPANASFLAPILEYSHDGGNCSVTGGYVYRGSLAEWQGMYLFGDYCSGTVWMALPDLSGTWRAEEVFRLPVRLASFGEDENGELYAVDLSGDIYRLYAR